MKTDIHSTAIIEDGAKIGQGVRIGPYCHIGPDVVLGDNVMLHAHVSVMGRTTIGEGTQVYPFASLGSPPQDLKHKGEPTTLVIGKNNTIREHVTMNTGTLGGGGTTVVGDGGLFMMGAHVAHDCVVGNNVIFANNATLGGHVVVGDHAVLGGLTGVHQFVRIGNHAVIGGVVAVDTDVIPFGRAKGARAQMNGLNLVGLERRGFTKDLIRILQKAYNQLFADQGTFEQRLDSIEQDYADQPQIQDIVKFARAKTRFPICQPPRKD